THRGAVRGVCGSGVVRHGGPYHAVLEQEGAAGGGRLLQLGQQRARGASDQLPHVGAGTGVLRVGGEAAADRGGVGEGGAGDKRAEVPVGKQGLRNGGQSGGERCGRDAAAEIFRLARGRRV